MGRAVTLVVKNILVKAHVAESHDKVHLHSECNTTENKVDAIVAKGDVSDVVSSEGSTPSATMVNLLHSICCETDES